MLSASKKTVGILFGGKSAEHEVSIRSAKNIANAIDRNQYEVVLIGIDKAGRWSLCEPSWLEHRSAISAANDHEQVSLVPQGNSCAIVLERNAVRTALKVDVVFPVLHGPMGEDGTVQGMLKLAGIPFVGSGVLGSAVGMDKDVAKRLLRDVGIGIVDFITVHRGEIVDAPQIFSRLGTPVFVKPANLGSSVGVSKAGNLVELQHALDQAFQFDHKVLVEAFADAREIECAVLGNREPAASVVGEIIPSHEFYSYAAKYLDDKGAALAVPADIDAATSARVRELSLKVFQVLGCEGMARVDFFLSKDGALRVNEINTIPGFTAISMYPRLWEASGVPYTELITRLIELALERHASDLKLRTAF